MPKVKKLRQNPDKYTLELLYMLPNFHKSGSITGMKKLYYGKDALLVRHKDFIYNCTSEPSIYHSCAD